MKNITARSIGAILLVIPVSVLAQAPASLIPEDGIVGTCKFLVGEVHFGCIPQYIGYLIRFLLGFAGGFLLFGIMIAGYKYIFGSITSSGTEAGKKELIARVVGFAIIVLSYLLVDTLLQALT